METNIDSKQVWNSLVNLMEDRDFDSDGDTSIEEQRKMFDEVISQSGITSSTTNDLFDSVRYAGREYYYCEHAADAPGSRSTHRSSYIKHKTLARNYLREIMNLPKVGVNESIEIDDFLRENGHRFTEQFSQYKPVGTLFEKEISTKFPGVKKILSDLVGVCEDRYGTKKLKNERSGWNKEIIEYAGILLRNLEKRLCNSLL